MKLLFNLTYPFMMIALRVFFRRVYFPGLKDIPTDKPVIFTTNHHNSFLDGIILTVLVKQRLHILARGDVFGSPFKKWLLGQFYLLPIYRKSEAANNLEKNQESFRAVKEVLSKGHSVLIFPEGVSIQEKRLQRPLKKGFARIAFGSAFDPGAPLDLCIYPMGINFTKPWKLRGDVIVSCGSAIEISDYQEAYENNPSAASTKLVREVEKQLLDLVVIVEDPKNDELAEAALTMARNDQPMGWKWLSKDPKRFVIEKHIATWAGKAASESRKRMAIYFRELSRIGLTDYGFSKKPNSSSVFLFLLGLPFFILGWLYRLRIGRLAKNFTQQKVKLKEFYGSVYLSLGMILYLVHGIIVFTIAGLLYGSLGLAIATAWALCGWLSVYYEAAFQLKLQEWKAAKLKRNNPKKWEELSQTRGQIMAELAL